MRNSILNGIFFLALSGGVAADQPKFPLDKKLIVKNVYEVKRAGHNVFLRRIARIDEQGTLLFNRTNIAVTRFASKFQDLLGNERRATFRKTLFVLDIAHLPPDAHAEKFASGNRQILINRGWIELAGLMVDAFAYNKLYESGDTSKIDPFAAYVVKTVAFNIKNQTPRDIQRYCFWSKFKDCTARQGQDEFRKLSAKMFDASMDFVFGHELGHVILGHVDRAPGEETVYERELAADKFSSDLMRKSGIDPRLSAGSLALLLMLNPDIVGAPLNTGQHPPGICRLMIIERDADEADIASGSVSDAAHQRLDASLSEEKTFLAKHPECTWTRSAPTSNRNGN